MIAKVKKDTIDAVKLVVFEDEYVKVAGGLGLFFFGLDALIIAILVILWDEIHPILDQTPFVGFILFLSVLCFCCYGSFPRFVKYITINKKDGYIEIFNLVATRGASLLDVRRVRVQEEAYKQSKAWLQLAEGKQPLLLFACNPAVKGQKGATMQDAVFLIEKHLTIAMRSRGRALDTCITPGVKDMRGWRDDGLECMEKGQFKEAVNAFENAITQDVRDAFSWNDLGMARERVGDVDGAIDAYVKLLELRPRNAFGFHRLAAIAGKEHPAVRAARKKSALVTAWNGISIVLLIACVVACMIAGMLMIGAVFMPELLVAGSDWPVPDVAGRVQYFVNAGIVYVIGTFFVAITTKNREGNENFKASLIVLHLLVQYMYVGIIFMNVFMLVFTSGLEVAHAGIAALDANRIMFITGLVILMLMPVYVSFAAIMILAKGSKKEELALGRHQVMASIRSVLGGPLATTGLFLLALHVGLATPPFIAILAAIIPFCYHPFIDRSLAPKYRLAPGILMEAAVLCMVGFGPLGIIYMATGGFSVYMLFRLEQYLRKHELEKQQP